MLNIIKMDFYRMLKSKSQYILWILLTVMLVLTTASMRKEYKDPQASANNWETMQEGVEDTAENLGMYVTVPTEPGQKATLYDMFYANTQGKVEAIFIVIFAVLFATADIRSGYIKNIGGQCRRRSDLVISKAVILFSILRISGDRSGIGVPRIYRNPAAAALCTGSDCDGNFDPYSQ